jgi:type VI secretion system secreted protein VgrG
VDVSTDLGCRFNSSALDGTKARVLTVLGTERLGHLFEFRVRFRYDGPRLSESDLDQLVLAPCALVLSQGADVVHGIARAVETVDSRVTSAAIYEVVLVPTMWLLTVSSVSRIYQQMSVKDMAQDVLTRYKFAPSHFDLRITGAPRDFVIQYHESDWDFLSRWFEHEGFFYWFEHTTDGEKLVVAASNSDATMLSGKSFVAYSEEAGLARTGSAVFDWRCVQQRIPARVVLKDYSYANPSLLLVGKADVDTKLGFGTFFEYGDNFDAPDLGTALAKVRAERFLAEQRTYHGVTDCANFHVGHSFDLIDHPDDAQNREYLITAITHHVGPIPETGRGDATSAGLIGYRAHFEAIPLSVQFRPERKTEWPSIHGVMHGHIDSAGSGMYSTLDSQARYRVRFPFDSSGKTGDKSSTWVRLVQPYAGADYGSHHPLHLGTEVVLAFLDGDPDRPIILGAVSNAQTPSPAIGANASQSVTKTASGITLTYDDNATGS